MKKLHWERLRRQQKDGSNMRNIQQVMKDEIYIQHFGRTIWKKRTVLLGSSMRSKRMMFRNVSARQQIYCASHSRDSTRTQAGPFRISVGQSVSGFPSSICFIIIFNASTPMLYKLTNCQYLKTHFSHPFVHLLPAIKVAFQ